MLTHEIDLDREGISDLLAQEFKWIVNATMRDALEIFSFLKNVFRLRLTWKCHDFSKNVLHL